MPVSTSMLANMTSVITNGPKQATLDAAIAAGGPIQDYQGNCKLALLKLQEADKLANILDDMTNSADSANEALLDGIVDVLEGTGSPSDSVITDIGLVIAAGPGNATLAACIAASGQILDYQGLCKLLLLKFQEAYKLIYSLHAITDTSTDSANKTLLANLLLTLV